MAVTVIKGMQRRKIDMKKEEVLFPLVVNPMNFFFTFILCSWISRFSPEWDKSGLKSGISRAVFIVGMF
jgi:hypothetical protein